MWGLWLWLEGLRRELERWSSSRCGGFEIRGEERVNSAGERAALTRHPWRRGRERERTERERVMELARGGWEVVRDFNATRGVGRGELVGRHVAATDEPRSWSG
jgi:hypothetical protein